MSESIITAEGCLGYKRMSLKRPDSLSVACSIKRLKASLVIKISIKGSNTEAFNLEFEFLKILKLF